MAEKIEKLKLTYDAYLGINDVLKGLDTQVSGIDMREQTESDLISKYFASNAEDAIAAHYYFKKATPDYLEPLYADPAHIQDYLVVDLDITKQIASDIHFLPTNVKHALSFLGQSRETRVEIKNEVIKNAEKAKTFLSENLPALKEYEAVLKASALYKDDRLPENVLTLTSSEQYNLTVGTGFFGTPINSWFPDTFRELLPGCKNAYDIVDKMTSRFDVSLGTVQRPVVSSNDKNRWEKMLNIADNSNKNVHRIILVIKGEDHNNLIKDGHGPVQELASQLKKQFSFNKEIKLHEPDLEAAFKYTDKLFEENIKLIGEIRQRKKDGKDFTDLIEKQKLVKSKIGKPDPNSNAVSSGSFNRVMDECKKYRTDILNNLSAEEQKKHRFETLILWDVHSASYPPVGNEKSGPTELATPGYLDHYIQLDVKEPLFSEKERESQLKKLEGFEVFEIIFGCQSGGAVH